MPPVTREQPATEPTRKTPPTPVFDAVLAMVEDAERRGIRMALERIGREPWTEGSLYTGTEIRETLRLVAEELGAEMTE